MAEEDISQQITQVPPESNAIIVTYVGDMILLTQAAERRRSTPAMSSGSTRIHPQKLLMAKLLDAEAKAASTKEAMQDLRRRHRR